MAQRSLFVLKVPLNPNQPTLRATALHELNRLGMIFRCMRHRVTTASVYCNAPLTVKFPDGFVLRRHEGNPVAVCGVLLLQGIASKQRQFAHYQSSQFILSHPSVL